MTKTPETPEEEKAKANRERVAKTQPAKETDRSRWEGSKQRTEEDSTDKKTNEKFAGGKSWKQIIQEEKDEKKKSDKGKG